MKNVLDISNVQATLAHLSPSEYPSLLVLIEPNRARFCANNHAWFETLQEALNAIEDDASPSGKIKRINDEIAKLEAKKAELAELEGAK